MADKKKENLPRQISDEEYDELVAQADTTVEGSTDTEDLGEQEDQEDQEEIKE